MKNVGYSHGTRKARKSVQEVHNKNVKDEESIY